MAGTECCKNCKHCIDGRASAHGWCSLRKIKVHQEISPFVFCHHWIQREPSLPIIEDKYAHIDHQLDFGKAFANSEN